MHGRYLSRQDAWKRQDADMECNVVRWLYLDVLPGVFRKSQTVDVFVRLIMLGLVVTVMFVRSSPTEIDVIQ